MNSSLLDNTSEVLRIWEELAPKKYQRELELENARRKEMRDLNRRVNEMEKRAHEETRKMWLESGGKH